jgi:hypothetical protein
MVSKMNTEVRPTRMRVSIRSERTIRTDLFLVFFPRRRRRVRAFGLGLGRFGLAAN